MLKLLYPLLWPIYNVMELIGSPRSSKLECKGMLQLQDQLTSIGASIRSSLIGYMCMFVLFNRTDYPAFGKGEKFSLDWIMAILLRNVIGTWIICGGWDWILYFSPISEKFKAFKMTPKYPPLSQMKHDAMFTTLSSILAGAIEICLCYGWANKLIPMDTSLMDRPILNLIALSTITHWRIPHFYFIHRGMHPWRTKRIPDLGKIAYHFVHSLHHKSYNPTAFSGTSMHPIESTLYYSAALIPVFFGLHPLIALACIVDLGMGAWLGHDGFQWPGQGDYFHILHHKHFDCNYGSPHVPLDAFFGTFAPDKASVHNLWKGEKVGEENNDTEVHAD